MVQRRVGKGGERGRRWKHTETRNRERERLKQCKVGHTFIIKSKPNPSVCARWNYLILLACESLWSTSQVCDWISAQQNLKLHTYCAWVKPGFTVVEKASPGLLGSVRSSACSHLLVDEWVIGLESHLKPYGNCHVGYRNRAWGDRKGLQGGDGPVFLNVPTHIEGQDKGHWEDRAKSWEEASQHLLRAYRGQCLRWALSWTFSISSNDPNCSLRYRRRQQFFLSGMYFILLDTGHIPFSIGN